MSCNVVLCARGLPPADQTLSVFEPPQPNTGLPGGKFLERAKVYKPGSKLVGGGRAYALLAHTRNTHTSKQQRAAQDQRKGTPAEAAVGWRLGAGGGAPELASTAARTRRRCRRGTRRRR